MATNLVPAPTGDEQKLGVAEMRKRYNKIATTYNEILDCDVMHCARCDNWYRNTGMHKGFYQDSRFKSGFFPLCKECVQALVEQRKKDGDIPNETKDSVKFILQLMDKPYYDDLYTKCVDGVDAKKNDPTNRKVYVSPFSVYITQIQSLPQYKGRKWKDSKFGNSEERPVEEHYDESDEIFVNAKKHFGNEYTLPDLYYLETEYSDWCDRYECNTKAQEELFKNIAFTQLELHKARLNNENTDKLTATLQKLMETGDITPKQNKNDVTGGVESFGQLIQKLEETRPVAEIDPELKDVDKIGLYISVYFFGHLCKMLGIKNKYSKMYDDYMQQYAATRPEFSVDEDSEDIFNKIYGGSLDE